MTHMFEQTASRSDPDPQTEDDPREALHTLFGAGAAPLESWVDTWLDRIEERPA